MNIEDIRIYRMTHIMNIAHILKYGITHKNSRNANGNYKDIGDVSLISTRADRTVIVDNGIAGNPDGESIVLGEFIPFYFGVKMPMLYVVQNGGNFVESATPPGEIIYMVCRLNDVISEYRNFYFSDGHATDSLTCFYNSDKIRDIAGIVKWKSVKAPYWGGSENLDVKREKQAEFLIRGDVSAKALYEK